MNVFILAIGTRGDIEAFLILGREMRRRRHRVTIGTSCFYSQRVLDSQLDMLPIGTGTAEGLAAVVRSIQGIADVAQRGHHYSQQWVLPQVNGSRETIRMRAIQADYFISSLKMTVRHEGQVVPGAFVTYDLPASLKNVAYFNSHNHEGRTLELVAMNKQLIDFHNDWDARCRFTGFWLDAHAAAGWAPAGELVQFLKRGTPPVVITLGSMGVQSPALARAVTGALRLSGRRGLFLGRWPGAEAIISSNDLFNFTSDIPYLWLFPQACCIVHHGATGTASLSLAAGVPSIVLPQIAPQYRLAHVLQTEGLATAVFDTRSLDAQKLAAAIGMATTEPKYQKRAKAWQQVIARDDGAATAANLIEQHWRELTEQGQKEMK